ncbi:class I SAM-dependent methyltransferase [Delftia sp. PS-11]|uniref:class I SAM-dependent methyltransferase n=1 Tax=Delftia sp. PS-11 TaxID=2767222 RepID=UPI002455CA9D|nr:class I SAM-dependent methyltransferase [Delftia sp. PS-11]KAJ8746417.1 class I SAM-dependent methyltransferase [Delftia sp. PS-11]
MSMLAADVPVLRQFQRAMVQDDREKAEGILRQALVQEPNRPAIHVALARLRWPGPDYLHWLAWFHRQLQPAVYLEIGVESGKSLALVQPRSHVIAIDPAPVGNPLQACPAKGELFCQTSAAFFSHVPPDSLLARSGFDLAFIDGDHRFDTVLDDFIAVEKHASANAFVLLHDTLPLTASTSGSIRATGFYSGDAWKIVPCLRALRPDLRITTVPAAPTGLTVITGLNPGSTLLREQRDAIRQAYADLPSEMAVDHPHALLMLGRNDPAWMQDWLAHVR